MAFTTTSSVDLAQAAYDRLAYFALRPELYFDNAADVMPTRQAMPGATVTFTIMNDLAAVTSALVEATDVTPVALSDSQVTVTLAEYGSAVVTTAKLRGEAFVEVDPIVANIVGYNAGVSIDSIARAVLEAGTNVDYAGGAPIRGNLVTANVLTSALIRTELARLRSFNVPTFGGYYTAYIHPNCAYDLKAETGTQGWVDPHAYSQPAEIWQGEIGTYSGSRFVETPRAPVFPTGGSAGIPVYQTLFLGRQALAKAHSIVDGNGPTPHIVPGPITDYLRRFVPWGWYWLGGYSIFRQAALRRVESASSLSYVDPTIDN